MVFTGQYYGTYEYPSNAAVPHYFPGNSLWQYWFVALTHYTEGNVYFAHYIFLILPLLLIFDDLNLRQFVWFAYGVFIILVAVHNFGHGLINIYVLNLYFDENFDVQFFLQKENSSKLF